MRLKPDEPTSAHRIWGRSGDEAKDAEQAHAADHLAFEFGQAEAGDLRRADEFEAIHMTQRPPILDHFLEQLTHMWTPSRLATLGRISIHRRQFENWWKFELATFLWEFAASCDAEVFVESHDRADITIATPLVIGGCTYVNVNGPVCVPIELKTTGTWWGSRPSAIVKALEESRKKRLADDLCKLAQRGRNFIPFGVVALLITDAEDDPATLDAYSTHASQLAAFHALREVVNVDLPLPAISAELIPRARQLIWASW